MGATSSGSMGSSAVCRYRAGIFLYSAHNRAAEGAPLRS